MWCVLRHIVNDSTRPYNPVAFLPYSHVIVDDEGSGSGSSDGGSVCFFFSCSVKFTSLPPYCEWAVYSLCFAAFIHD